jgi:Zn-finger nucleic acid-binding protein
VDYCPKCRGAFYDEQEIQVPLEDGVPGEKTFACPKCRSLMLTSEHFDGKLTLERCESCRGIWFDSGEVLKLKELAGTEDVVRPGQTPGALDAPSKDETVSTLLGFLYDIAVEIATHPRRRRRRLF